MRTLIASVAALCVLLWTASTQSPRTVWEGVFTKAQAERGHGIFGDECSGCHGDNLETGGDNGPALAGDGFKDEWNGKTLAELFTLLSMRMPQSSPGSLKKAEYADLLAYILSENDFPAGAKELDQSDEALKQIKFQATK
jgi:mono/diheme cytochrome c family protein